MFVFCFVVDVVFGFLGFLCCFFSVCLFFLNTWYIASGFVCARELTWRSHVDCDDSFYGRLGRSCDVYTYRGDVCVCVASQTQIKLVFLLLSLLLYTQKFGDFIWLCYVCDIIYGLLWFLEICFRGR